MPRLRISELVRDELDEIWFYIAGDNPEAATNVVASITKRFDMLASYPGMGTARDDLSTGLRSFPVGKYVIFFRFEANVVEIVRVIHGARDVEAIFRRNA